MDGRSVDAPKQVRPGHNICNKSIIIFTKCVYFEATIFFYFSFYYIIGISNSFITSENLQHFLIVRFLCAKS